MPKVGSIQYEYLSKYISSDRDTVDGYVNMRGFDWSQGNKQRFKYWGDHFVGIDFSDSRAETGFVVRNATFENCIFSNSMWWLAVFTSCQFIKCTFNNCRFYNTRLSTPRGRFIDCTFINMSAKGEGFDFGWASVYTNCIFESILIRNVGDVVGVRFEDCTISGTLTEGIFRGRRFALKQRFASLRDVFSAVYRSVKFIRCDLSNLKTENVVFEKDVIFRDCQR